jgi:hypothetical protein
MDLIDNKLLLESHISMICAGFGQLGKKEVPESMGKVAVIGLVHVADHLGPCKVRSREAKKVSKEEGAMATTY